MVFLSYLNYAIEQKQIRTGFTRQRPKRHEQHETLNTAFVLAWD